MLGLYQLGFFCIKHVEFVSISRPIILSGGNLPRLKASTADRNHMLIFIRYLPRSISYLAH